MQDLRWPGDAQPQMRFFGCPDDECEYAIWSELERPECPRHRIKMRAAAS